jgi:molybdopterin converting factor small subunit
MKTQEELIARFAKSMHIELQANKNKGDWREWGEVDNMRTEIDYHLQKLDDAIEIGDRIRINEHLADCANFLLMIGNAYRLY